MTSDVEMRAKLLGNAFQMPSFQTMVSRMSSITNAFVNSVVPMVPPTIDEIDEALSILEIKPQDVRCAYCGDKSSEWDHLRPLVIGRRPTGFISEIANLVPACGKCNQSKGNKPWREWMLSKTARHSPTSRGRTDVTARIDRLVRFEQWKSPTKIDFVAIIGRERWEHYWSLCEAVIDELKQCQEHADSIHREIVGKLGPLGGST